MTIYEQMSFWPLIQKPNSNKYPIPTPANHLPSPSPSLHFPQASQPQFAIFKISELIYQQGPVAYIVYLFINEQEETLQSHHPRRLSVIHLTLSVGKTSLLNAYTTPHAATSIKNSYNPIKPQSEQTSWRRKSSSMEKSSILKSTPLLPRSGTPPVNKNSGVSEAPSTEELIAACSSTISPTNEYLRC